MPARSLTLVELQRPGRRFHQAAGPIGLKHGRQIWVRAVSKTKLKGIPIYMIRKILKTTQVFVEAKTWREYFVSRLRMCLSWKELSSGQWRKGHQPIRSQAWTLWGRGFGETNGLETYNLGWGQKYRDRTNLPSNSDKTLAQLVCVYFSPYTFAYVNLAHILWISPSKTHSCFIAFNIYL